MEQETKINIVLIIAIIIFANWLWNITPRYKLEKHMTVISNGVITPESTWAIKGDYCKKITPYLITDMKDKDIEYIYDGVAFKKAPNDTVVCYGQEWEQTKDWGFKK